MVNKKEVTLKSGTVVNLRPLNIFEISQVEDIAFTFASRQEFPIMYTYARCLQMIGFSEEEIEKLTKRERVEAGEWILQNSKIDELQKKK